MPPHATPQAESVWEVAASCPSLDSRMRIRNEKNVRPGKGRRKKVSFADDAVVHEVPHTNDMLDEDVQAIWYDETDYDRIKNDFNETIEKYANGCPILEEEGHCMRGLEAKTKFGARRRKNNRAAALDSVWDTQVSQWKRKMDDQSAIAAAYKPHGVHSKYPALEAACRDEMYVKEQVRGS